MTYILETVAKASTYTHIDSCLLFIRPVTRLKKLHSFTDQDWYCLQNLNVYTTENASHTNFLCCIRSVARAEKAIKRYFSIFRHFFIATDLCARLSSIIYWTFSHYIHMSMYTWVRRKSARRIRCCKNTFDLFRAGRVRESRSAIHHWNGSAVWFWGNEWHDFDRCWYSFNWEITVFFLFNSLKPLISIFFFPNELLSVRKRKKITFIVSGAL